MKRIISIAALSLFLLGSSFIIAQMNTNTPIKNVSAHEAQAVVKSGEYIILDIRTPMEFNASRIKGATNIDFYKNTFKDNLNKLDKEKAYFVYCRSGNRTGQSMRLFASLGFKNIVHLQHGIVDWTRSGYTMEK